MTEKLINLIVNYAEKRKDVDYLNVWLSDDYNNIYECKECIKELLADLYVRMLNKLDERLTKKGLDTKISFLLYHELLYTPENERIQKPNRFTMMFAAISRTYEKSFADIDYRNNIPKPEKYERSQIILPNSLEDNLAYLFEWQEVFLGDSFIYDYPLGRAHYGDLGYMKINKLIHQDIKFLYELKLNGYISFQELRSGFPHNFPNYIMGKTLWNKEVTYESLKEEYFSSMYGDSGCIFGKVIRFIFL